MASTQYNKFLEFAKQLALKAGNILIENRGKSFKAKDKGNKDYATNVDIMVERIIVDEIKKNFPDHSIVGEELGSTKSSSQTVSQFTWYIDPLDGTKNYFNGINLFAVSIALVKNNAPIVAVVYNPATNELFYAAKGEGAYLGGCKGSNGVAKRITIAKKKEFEGCILATNPGYTRSKFESIFYRAVARKVSTVRILGSVSMDLCYLACGRLDIYMNSRSFPWDFVAGVLIAEEAGAIVTTSQNMTVQLKETDLVVSNTVLHEQVLKIANIIVH